MNRRPTVYETVALPLSYIGVQKRPGTTPLSFESARNELRFVRSSNLTTTFVAEDTGTRAAIAEKKAGSLQFVKTNIPHLNPNGSDSRELELFLPPSQLSGDLFCAGRAGYIPSFHCFLQIEGIGHIRSKQLFHGLQFGNRKLVERFPFLFGQTYHSANHMVSLAKRHSFQHKIVGQICCQKCRIARGS